MQEAVDSFLQAIEQKNLLSEPATRRLIRKKLQQINVYKERVR